MSATRYLQEAAALIDRISTTQSATIEDAAGRMADGVARGGLVNLFGSGHSILPAMDAFPRYGAFPAFRPLTDIRLSWHNVLGTGGVRELLWLEREEGYIANFKVAEEGVKKTIKIYLKYSPDNQPIISSIERVSRPGCRVSSYGRCRPARLYSGSCHSRAVC